MSGSLRPKSLPCLLGLAFSLGPISPAAADNFQDTPLTTELWQLSAKNDATKTDTAMEAFLYQNPDLALARSADKRGGLWWAWEYKNSFALAALKAYGADPLTSDEDEEGNTPQQMCDGEECASLLEKVDETVKEILARKADREKREAQDLEDDDDDDDLEDDDDKAFPRLLSYL
eukprot:g1173.t1